MIVEKDGKIVMQKTCAIHGDFEDLMSIDPAFSKHLEDVFPEVPLRPRHPVAAARMRYWNKFVDEQVMNYVSMHGWHRMVGVIARKIESAYRTMWQRWGAIPGASELRRGLGS